MNYIRHYTDPLSPTSAHQRKQTTPRVVLTEGMVIEEVETGFVGEVTKIGKVAGLWQFEMEDRHGIRRSFPFGFGYWIDGKAVELIREVKIKKAPETRWNNAGSLHVNERARVARASRIWVEGKHDNELVQKIWGEDLAHSGVVVEELGGADHLLEILNQFQPAENRRAGILLDHMVDGSKESRIADIARERYTYVHIIGHPYIDVWQAIKPSVLGLHAWPDVPKGEDFKRGTLQRLGITCESQEDIGRAWQKILAHVRTYKDLEPAFLGRVEELIDFVTGSANDQ